MIMGKTNEIIFFCYGDSSLASTWSNVPYLFTKTLEEKGVTVRRVDLLHQSLWTKVYNKLLIKAYNVFYKNHVYSYIRTPLYRKKTFSIIKNAVKKYPNADCCIFTCFDFWNKFNDIPTVLFCDWTYDILILERLGRKPYSFEKRYSTWQDEAITSADAVISLFPECAKSMTEKYKEANIKYLGGNVVNNLYESSLDPDKMIANKKSLKHLLFVGGKKYKDGCKLLIEAHQRLLSKGIECRTDIVGMTGSDFEGTDIPKGVNFHGYLKKENEKDRDLYYNLMLNASIFINPTETWAGYSSTIEAMYFYTPIIVSPYKDFVSEFGEDISFGRYNQMFNVECLSNNIESILKTPLSGYVKMCLDAHSATKDYSWSNYVDKVFSVIEKIKK